MTASEALWACASCPFVALAIVSIVIFLRPRRDRGRS